MCGICGFLNLDGEPVDKALLSRMSEVITHRGPDGSGMHTDGPVGLGHRRLAILDPARGQQPMSNEDGTVWVVYNGEVYNFPDLYEQLTAAGHTFRTKCDTEALVHLWEEHGPGMVTHLVGMFAFAVWDARDRCLFLARDRVGIKPLYYARYGSRFAFASELKSICQDPAFPKQIQPQALGRYFSLGYINHPNTIFEHAFKLPPAHTLLVSRKNPTPRLERYWSVSFQGHGPALKDEWFEEYRELLDRVVKDHLLSDVPLGAFLSGGLDSSLVVASMQRASKNPVQTYSIGFSESDFDELAHANAVAEHLGTKHRPERAEPELMDLLPRLAWQYDEPFGDDSCLPTHLVSRFAQRHVKVVLSGDGGDEVLGGYPRYMMTLGLNRFRPYVPPILRHLAFSPLLRRHTPGKRGHGLLQRLAAPYDGDYLRLCMQRMNPGEVISLLRPSFRLDRVALDDYESVLQQPGKPLLDRMQELDLSTYLPGDILTKVDRASMLVSLEVRVPFLDHRMIEFATRLPPGLRANREEGKILSRQLAYERLPHEVIDRPKMGFSLPLVHWFRGPLSGFLQEHLLGPGSYCRRMLSSDMIAAYLKRHREGRADHAAPLWLLLMFEFWCRTWLGPGTPP